METLSPTAPPQSLPPPPPQVFLMVAVVFLIHTALMSLAPLIAPLSRQLGLAEWQMGLVVSASALCMTLTSPAWGRLSQRIGPKRILSVTIASSALAMVGFAAVSHAAMRGMLSVSVVFALFIALRGVWFGLSGSAVTPTAQTYIASVTTTVEERVRGMAAVGVASGASLILGSGLGGLLGGVSTLLALWAVPVLLVLGWVVVMGTLRPAQQRAHAEPPARVSVADRRVWPYLVVAVGLSMALGFIQILSGFVVQDRLNLSAERATLVTGIILLSAGIGLIVSQAIVVPWLGLRPIGYIRLGALIATVGFALLIPDAGLWGLLGAATIIGGGMGLATPGFTAGISLAVNPEEQGSVAGLLASANALTVSIAPALATALYSTSAQIPLVAAMVVAAAVAAFAVIHPAIAAP